MIDGSCGMSWIWKLYTLIESHINTPYKLRTERSDNDHARGFEHFNKTSHKQTEDKLGYENAYEQERHSFANISFLIVFIGPKQKPIFL